MCRRRCRVLLAATPEAPVGCRICLQAAMRPSTRPVIVAGSLSH
jgi:hypothetical protein